MKCLLRNAAWILGGWTLMGLFFGLRNYANYAYAAATISASEAFAQGLTEGYVWALLTPPIVVLSTRFRLGPGGWARRLPIHLIAAVLVASLHTTLFVWAAASIRWIPARTPAAAEVFQNLLTYLVIAGLSHGLQIHAQAQERQMRASRLQTQLTEARLGLLQAQLQPHFLFNAMHAISELMHEDVERAETMITDLSYLLRLSLDNAGVQQVPLAREMEFVERYLDIEGTRFEDRLAVGIDVPDELLGARVPYLALQPLVENALRHAVAKQPGPSRIDIRARRDGEALTVAVQDTGPGNEQASGIDGKTGVATGLEAGVAIGARADAARSSRDGAGVGLKNTRSRLQELYGDRQSLELEQVGSGVCATLSVPLVFEGSDAD